MFRWFESRLDPYPVDLPRMPPKGLWRFILHFSRGAWGYMLAMSACSALIFSPSSAMPMARAVPTRRGRK